VASLGLAPLAGDAMVTGSTSGIVAVVGGWEEEFERWLRESRDSSFLFGDGWIHVATARYLDPNPGMR